MQDMAILDQSRKLDAVSTGIFKAGVFRDWMKGGFKPESIRLPEQPYFLSTNKKQIDTYINLLFKYSTTNSWFILNTETAVKMAVSLDSLIKKEYHLE
jgi:hypothetical protein